ncbi:MAG: tetratricopeptide repeat protein [candidate division Zixibacteria bacterium]|nr:tetratricopeptide repeat protein [candidate division Zixibacteria bacterium]
MYDGKVKLTKRQIKEDKFTTFVLSSRQHVSDNWQFLVIGIVVVILIGVAGAYYLDSQKEAALRESDSYARAMMEYRSGNLQVALASLTQAIETISDKGLLEKSIYALGNINFETRNYPEAIRYWEMYIAQFHDNPLNRSAAMAGLASVYENQAQFAEAATNFVEAAAAFEDGPLEGDYLAGAVRNYLLVGDIEQARAQLGVIEEKYESTELYKRVARNFAEKSQP